MTLLLSSLLLPFGTSAATGKSELSGILTINSDLISNAVVYLIAEDEKPLAMQPMDLTIIQKELQFSPPFSTVTMGSTLFFENHDDDIHNARSTSPSNRFNIGSQQPGTIKKVVLKKHGIVSIQCSLHPEMNALVFVSPSPFFSQTDSGGKFKIKDVPVGTYWLGTWFHSLTRREMLMQRRKIVIEKKSESLFLTLTAKGGVSKDTSIVVKKDWFLEVDAIEVALGKAFSRWRHNSFTSAASRIMRIQSNLYRQSGLRNAIAKNLGEPRALDHEMRLDNIRKSVQGLKGSIDLSTLKKEMASLLSDLRKDAEAIKGL